MKIKHKIRNSNYLIAFFLLRDLFFYNKLSNMQNEMLDLIKKEKSHKTETSEKSKKNTWLVFTIGKKLYALPAGNVKEILRDTEIFPLPFAPDYLNGVVNRYGDPYAVIDPAILINEPAQSSLLFIVINDESHSCFRITDVKDFYTTDEKNLVHFAQADLTDFFEGTININGEEALVLKTQVFLDQLGNDIAS